MNSKTPRIRIMAPKGYKDHDDAGRKLARLASEKRLGVRHRGKLHVIFGRIQRI